MGRYSILFVLTGKIIGLGFLHTGFLSLGILESEVFIPDVLECNIKTFGVLIAKSYVVRSWRGFLGFWGIF